MALLMLISSSRFELGRLPVCPLRELSALRVFAHRSQSGGYASLVEAKELEQVFALVLRVRYLQTCMYSGYQI